MLNSKTGTDGGYPNSQLKHWTEIMLRDLKGRRTERKKLTGLLQNPSQKKPKKILDWQMRAAGHSEDEATYEI